MQWKRHPNFPDYIVSEACDVVRTVDTIRSKAGTVIRGRILQTKGYRQFKLVNADGVQVAVQAHRFLAEIFLGPPPTTAHHAAHNDGDKANNHISNIRWATAKENNADKRVHGTRQNGGKGGMSRLTREIVLAIREEYDGQKGTKTRLSEKYGVARSHVTRIISGTCWDDGPFPDGLGRSALDRRHA